MSSNEGVSRRAVLTGVGALALAGGLSACSTTGSTSTGGNGSSSGPVTLPSYQPIAGITPDLKGTESGVPDGFLRYPAEPSTASTEIPGKGGQVAALLSSFAVTPTTADRNTYLAGLNTKLGTDLQLQVVPASDYATKIATTISGGQLPDVLEFPPATAQLPQILNATCADLTDLVSGDAISAYPNLAAYTADMWRTTIFDNKVFGIPVPRPLQSFGVFVRTDLLEQRGLSADPKSWDELVELCAALTSAKDGRYALSNAPISYLTSTLGGINDWVDEGGTLRRLQETEQFRQALTWCAELNTKGYLHPDAFAANSTTLGKQRLAGGQIGIHLDGYSAWGSLARFLPEGGQDVIGSLSVNSFDGATPTYPVGAGSSNFTAIKKADEGRVRELLAILNYLAAPFGSKEFLYRKYGTEGQQHTSSGGNPILTQQGTDQITPVTEALDYHLVDGVKVAYEGSLTAITQAKYDFALANEPGYVRSAVNGLYSDTYSRQNGAFLKTMTDVQNGVITGRQPISALDDALKNWNAGDGATIKAEFAAAREAQ